MGPLRHSLHVRHIVSITIVAAAIGLSAVAAGLAGWLPETRTNQAPDTAAALRDIESLITRAIKANVTPGLGVAIVRDSHIVYVKGFGVTDQQSRRAVNSDTQFYIASTSKTFTALAGAILAERKAIDLDWPLSRALPGVVMHPKVSADDITLRELLTHGHGISPNGPIPFRTAYSGEFTNDLLLDLLRVHGPAPGGKTFAYSNFGYNLFGLVLDHHFKQGWKQVLHEEIFEPLEMASTTALRSKTDPARLAQPHELGPDGPELVAYAKQDANMQAAGGHITTASDLAQYLVAEMNGGRVAGHQVLPEAAIRETHRQQIGQDRNYGSFRRFGAGLGWDLATYDGNTVLQRFGGFQGFHSHLSFMPEPRIGVVVLANGGGASSVVADLISTYAYDRLLNKPTSDLEARWKDFISAIDRGRAAIVQDRATRRARPQTTPLPLQAYAGTYVSPILGRMEWTLVDGTLRARMGIAECGVEIYNGALHQLRVTLTGSGSVVTFEVPPGATQPTGLRFMNEPFTRERQPGD